MTMSDTPGALNRRDVQRRFDRAARHFHQADFVHRHAAAGLFDRLLPMQLEPARILDLGAATGRDRKALAGRFRGALVISLDNSLEMLKLARRRGGWPSRPTACSAS